MAQCTTCGAYTKYEGGLCYTCYTKSKGRTADEEEEDAPTGGLSDREWTRRYNMIKGRIAETLVQELFLSLGYSVFRYGMENTIPAIMDLLRHVRSDVAMHIRRMPDFVVQNPKDNSVHFVEVKFRASGSFEEKDLQKDYPYDNALIVVVSKKHIKCISVPELRAGKAISPTCRNYLGSRKEFELDKETIKDFCVFAVMFFESVEDPKTK
ncbi:MAG: hypothetical protein JNL52_09030 [Flavobacteriales bacterium]|nr:hypothetical protein [Flavobacteriales bacterium]